MKKYEYKVLNNRQLLKFASRTNKPQDEDNQFINSALNNLGKKGWELIQTETDNITGYKNYYLKKEKK